MHPAGLIRLLIQGRGLTQEQLAERTGLSEKHVSRLTSGQSALSVRSAQLLGEALGVPPEVLILGQYLERRDAEEE